MLKVIYSGQMRGLINNGGLSLAPRGLPVIICTLTACVHCLLISRCSACSEGWRRPAPWQWWQQRRQGPPAGRPIRRGPRRARCPWGQPGDCRAEWMDGCVRGHKFNRFLTISFITCTPHSFRAANTPATVPPPGFASTVNKAYGRR